jgi:tetratricopeptide (TPR) repeat protein
MRAGAVIVLLLCLAPASARADEGTARAHYASGRAYYDQGRYEDALREFEEALRAAPDAQKGLMVFNVAQVQERLGRIEEAVASFQRYLALVPDAEDRASVEARVQTLQARLTETGILLTASEEGARVFVDGQESGTTPLAGPIRVAPGSHELRVEKEGFRPFRLRVSVEAGRSVETEVTLVAVERREAPPPPPPAPTRSGWRLLPWVVAGVAGVAIIGGTIFGVLALGESDAANDEKEGDLDLYDEASSSAETWALLADVSFGVGAAAAVGAVVLFLVTGGEESSVPPSGAALRVTPLATGRAVGLVFTGDL